MRQPIKILPGFLRILRHSEVTTLSLLLKLLDFRQCQDDLFPFVVNSQNIFPFSRNSYLTQIIVHHNGELFAPGSLLKLAKDNLEIFSATHDATVDFTF